MYGVILMATLASSAEVPDFHLRRGGCSGAVAAGCSGGGARAGLFGRLRSRRGSGCGGGQASYGCSGGQAAFGRGVGTGGYYAPVRQPGTILERSPAEPLPPPTSVPPKEKTSLRSTKYIQVCENGICRMVAMKQE